MNIVSDKYQDLMATAKEHKVQYGSADPFPNIYFPNFFNEDFLNQVHQEFPDLAKVGDIKFNNPNEVKLATRGEQRFSPAMKQFVHFLNSEPFLMFLQELTGIEEPLMPDPYFEGGGYHESKRGGFLKVHADFNKNKKTGLDRRLNVLVYMNKDWEDEWGGHFELWDREMKHCVKKVPPHFNTMALFSTTDFSYHGLPDPIMCPEGRSRRSIALYYYTNGRPAHEVNQGLEDHNTLFKARVGADKEMEKFNKSQGVKDLIKDLTPPLITRLAKKAMGKETVDQR
ncbi:MAG: 2OG-Fe(II) oxygenase [Saprospiraceae bacterium]